MNTTSPSLEIRSHLELRVPGCLKAVVSAPAIDLPGSTLQRKDLLAAGPVASDAKFTLEEHLDHLVTRQRLEPGPALLVLGLRNNLVNPRAILIHEGRPFAAEGEAPECSARPYFGIGWRDGRFVADTVKGQQDFDGWRAFFSGVPVLWDELSDVELFDQILTEASDHSHIYNLPRGNHPAATDNSRRAWTALHEVFLANLHTEFKTAAMAMHQVTQRESDSLTRCDIYFHSVLGVDADGHLVNIVGHGRLEDLGRAASALGCRRAICVENSGSIMPTWFSNGLEGPARPLIRAPNFRPKGRVLLVLELDSSRYDTLSS